MDENDEPPRKMLTDLLAALDRGQADVTAGRVVPGETVMADLGASIAEIEARRASKVTQAA